MTRDAILELSRSFQPACVLAAGVDFDVFTLLAERALAADEVAAARDADARGMAVLLDALTALGLLTKTDNAYLATQAARAVLSADGSDTALAMTQHQANCMRRWAQLSSVVRSGQPAKREPSVRGPAADQEAFIGAMNDINARTAPQLVMELNLPPFEHVLDIGGASGTWTLALLNRRPQARATLFDLPEVIPLAERRLRDAGVLDRVTLAPGDFCTDDLPGDADLAWLSAIAHQNSREQNRALFAKIRQALRPGGVLFVRDVVMDETRTHPPAGALFAVNMLVSTAGGGTYTFEEYRADLEAVGFAHVALVRESTWMDAFVRAETPR